MSFNVNSFNQPPSITGAQASQDGGAGNLGYMKGGNKNSKQKQELNSIFDDKPDTFTKSGLEEETGGSFLDNLISLFKEILNRLFKRN